MTKKVLKSIKVYVCVPATGKSWLADNDNRFIDLDKEEAIYKYGLDKKITNEDFGLIQGQDLKIINKNSEKYECKQLVKYLDQNKIVLSATHSHILNFLRENNIPYAMVQYNPKYIHLYRDRMKKRGNSEDFINKMLKTRKEHYYERKSDPNASCFIDLKKNQYLSDLLRSVYE